MQLNSTDPVGLRTMKYLINIYEFKTLMMKTRNTLFVQCVALLLLSACHPRIYEFNADPKSIGPNDPVRVSWKVKGVSVLTVRDYNYPGSAAAKLAELTLLVTQHGKTTAFLLSPDSTLKIPLAAEDSMSLRKKPDSITDDRLRYLTLVVSRNGQDSSRVVQIAVRPDSAADEIGFRPVIRGDSLVGEGINNPRRWGNDFDILSVADGSNRTMDVYHPPISKTIYAGEKPVITFKGTPVQGFWQFRTLMTAAEKNNHSLIPKLLKILVTLKHH